MKIVMNSHDSSQVELSEERLTFDKIHNFLLN